MKKFLLALLATTLATPALAAQQPVAQLSSVTASREALRMAINTQLSAVQSNFDEVYTVIDAGPVYVNTTAPADTKVVWIDTDQDNAIKVRIGEVWTVVGTVGEDSYTLPTAAADTLGGVKVGDRLSITDGVLSADIQTTDISGKENSLGNPSVTGYVLSSTTAGVRSWIEMTGGGTGIAHAPSDGNYYASKDGAWATLAGVFQPADADLTSAAVGSSAGNSKLFGTNSSGVVGWYDIPGEGAGLTSLPTADNQLLQATGSGTYAWTSTLEGIGDITGGTYNKITVTPPATGATLTLAEGSTLATSGAYPITLTSTAATNVTLPTTGTLLSTADVDDTPVNGVTTAPVSSNWAYDHEAAADPHTGYVLESAIGTTVQAYDADLAAWAGITPGSGVGAFLGTPSSANLASAVTDETGSGAAVFGTSPTIATPAITAAEVNGSADDTLTAAEVSSTIVYNTGQSAEDVALTLPTAASGYSAMFTVGTAQSNKWGVRAGTNDKIYLLAADGTVSAGDDNGYARMTAAQIGQSFACWTFKTDAYDWMCKAISIGTSTFTAN